MRALNGESIETVLNNISEEEYDDDYEEDDEETYENYKYEEGRMKITTKHIIFFHTDVENVRALARSEIEKDEYGH